MFEPTGFGADIFRQRYAIDENETWPEACRRVAESVGRDEPTSVREQFYNILVEGLFTPGGRVWYGAGRSSQGLLNCFVVPTEDSMAGWAKTVSDLMQISATGGGVGMNFSPLRGRGAPISRGGESTGAVSLMDMCDRVGDVLRSGGGRRVAMMHCLNIDHPDLYEFINAKKDLQRLNNANVSVIIPPGFDYAELDNSALFNEVVTNALKNGEPGILNQRLAEEMNPMSHQYPLISTNPCGEIWLPAYGVCCLGALVLPRFITGMKTINHALLARVTKVATRFLDCVLDQNDYPLQETEDMARGERRLGLGVMGLHSMFMDMDIKYGSESSYRVADSVFDDIKVAAYEASQLLALDKGEFDFWDNDSTPRLNGIPNPATPRRNVALLTVAPTGTTSLVMGVTSGIEPMFAPAYVRRHWVGDDLQETLIVTDDYLDHGELAQGAYDITPEQHFRMQATVQAHVDNAVSKTINLPASATVEDIKDVWFKYLPSLKGTTLYRAGSRENEPMSPVRIEDVPEMMRLHNGETLEQNQEEIADPCATGVCAL